MQPKNGSTNLMNLRVGGKHAAAREIMTFLLFVLLLSHFLSQTSAKNKREIYRVIYDVVCNWSVCFSHFFQGAHLWAQIPLCILYSVYADRNMTSIRHLSIQ